MINTITRTPLCRRAIFTGLIAVSGLFTIVPAFGTSQASEMATTSTGQNLPALDTAVPTNFETVSFGLG